jgi:hypothetical protein
MNDRDSTPSSDADDLRLVMIPVIPTSSSRIQSLVTCGKDLLETSGRYSLAPCGECLVEFMASEIRTKLNAGGLAQSSWRIFANRGQRDGKAYSIAEHDNGLRILVIEDGHVMNDRDSRDYVDTLLRGGEYTNLLTNVDDEEHVEKYYVRVVKVMNSQNPKRIKRCGGRDSNELMQHILLREKITDLKRYGRRKSSDVEAEPMKYRRLEHAYASRQNLDTPWPFSSEAWTSEEDREVFRRRSPAPTSLENLAGFDTFPSKRARMTLP